MASAGRTVLFSAVIVAPSMVPMVLFPMYFLKSFAYAGVAVVAFAACAALFVIPAAIVLLADRLDSFDIRRLARRLLRRSEPAPTSVEEETFWYRWAKATMRRTLPVGLAVTSLLLVLGAPFLGVRWGFPDDRVLPTSTSAYQVGDALRTDFATNSATNSATIVSVVIPDAKWVTPDILARYAAELSQVSGVSGTSSPVGMFVDGRQTAPPSGPTAMADGSAFLTVASTAPLFSDASEAQLDRLHSATPPNGQSVQLIGTGQINRDIVDAVISGLPVVLTVIAVITFLLIFLLTGSVVIPLKTLVLNVLSLIAAFGAVVWIPVRPSWRAGHYAYRDSGRERACVVVLHCVRSFHGLRGVPDIADSRVLAAFGSDPCRQRRVRCAGSGPHGARDHRRSGDHVDLVRRAHRGVGVVHADVRRRPDGRGPNRCDAGTDAAGASVHARDGPRQLVGAQAARPAARPVRHQRVGRSRRTFDAS